MAAKKSASLPPTLKSLITGPARSHPVPPPPESRLHELFDGIRKEAVARNVGWKAWLSITTATLITLNSPQSLASLHAFAISRPRSLSSTPLKSLSADADPPTSGPTASAPAKDKLALEEQVDRTCLMREAGIKCISFIGIAKVINNLAGLRSALSPELAAAMPTSPRRHQTPARLPRIQKTGLALFDDIYSPHTRTLLSRLGDSHPDLPVHIIESHYGPLLSDPTDLSASSGTGKESKTHALSFPVWEPSRLHTSLVGIASLRAMGGVGPQITSHVWGLLKAGEARRRSLASATSSATGSPGGASEPLPSADVEKWWLKRIGDEAASSSQVTEGGRLDTDVSARSPSTSPSPATTTRSCPDSADEEAAEGDDVEWLATMEGAEWVLRVVDRIVEVVEHGPAVADGVRGRGNKL